MTAPAAPRQFCTFYLGDQLFGLEVLEVQEVRRTEATTEVPLAPSVVRGLMNLRGSIVTCIDLRERFHLPAAPPEVEPIHVVTQTGDGLVSLEVDRIGDVVEVAEEDFELPPSTMDAHLRRLTAGVYKLEGSLLQILKTECLLEFDGLPVS